MPACIICKRHPLFPKVDTHFAKKGADEFDFSCGANEQLCSHWSDSYCPRHLDCDWDMEMGFQEEEEK